MRVFSIDPAFASRCASPPFGGPDVPCPIKTFKMLRLNVFDMSRKGLPSLALDDSILNYVNYYNSAASLKISKEEALQNINLAVTVAEWNATWALVRSKLWRLQRRFPVSSDLLLIAERNRAELLQSRLQDINVAAFEDIVREASDLTFEEKCVKTLQNLHYKWNFEYNLEPVPLPYDMHVRTAATFTVPKAKFEQGDYEDGMAYGCTESEAVLVYTYLVRQGLAIAEVGRTGINVFDGLLISPEGHMEVDRIKRGAETSIKQAFFIRRFDPMLDEFVKPVMLRVEEITGCKVEAVWERQHNDKIDDRILRLIRESPVVVLDVDKTRFNVGLEAGYALALKKPIIAIREKPDPWEPPPFDIATLNCFDYDKDDPDALIKVISERLLIGLNAVRQM